MDLTNAMKASRFSTQHFIGSFGQDPPKLGDLRLRDNIPQTTFADLKARGHKIRTAKHNIGGVCHVIY